MSTKRDGVGAMNVLKNSEEKTTSLLWLTKNQLHKSLPTHSLARHLDLQQRLRNVWTKLELRTSCHREVASKAKTVGRHKAPIQWLILSLKLPQAHVKKQNVPQTLKNTCRICCICTLVKWVTCATSDLCHMYTWNSRVTKLRFKYLSMFQNHHRNQNSQHQKQRCAFWANVRKATCQLDTVGLIWTTLGHLRWTCWQHWNCYWKKHYWDDYLKPAHWKQSFSDHSNTSFAGCDWHTCLHNKHPQETSKVRKLALCQGFRLISQDCHITNRRLR